MRKWLWAILTLLVSSAAQAFMPQSGLWAITSELDGRPGRGISFDVQNGTMVAMVYAYEKSNHPTFYIATGNLKDARFSARLIRYEGGRFFGSGPRSGVESASPGTVNIRFTSGVTGFVTFPGEPELAIRRFEFGYPFEASSLKGIFSFTMVGASNVTGGAVEFTRQIQATETGNGVVVSSDGLVACEHQVSGDAAGSVLCVEVNASGRFVRGYVFVYSVNDGEGVAVTSSGATEGVVFVRRLRTPSGVGTGIVLKSEASESAMDDVLRENIRMLAQSVN